MNTELQRFLKESRNAHKVISANEEDSALFRWTKKPVKEALLLDSMEDLGSFSFSGPGTVSVSNEKPYFYERCIKVECPTALEITSDGNRSYSYTSLIFHANNADWRKYNRISFWVYPDCPGFQNVWISMTIHNDGEVKYPRRKYFEGTHHMNVKNGQWNLFVWEIPYVYRDCATQVSINHNIHGSQCDMSDKAVLYFSRLELQIVDEDHYEGWELRDRLAYCHSGYQPGAEKIALSQTIDAENFSVLCAHTGEAIFTGPVEKVQTDLGTFQRMDFSALQTPGKYILSAGNKRTKPFYIYETNWESAVWKTVYFFYQKRCGTEVEGIHLPCHLDCFSVHPDGRRVSVGGGWHDAGDLSQGLCNTAESVHAFLDMAAKVEKRDPVLWDRLLEEARWGLQWMMRTRFGDGYRCVWTTIGLWTKNIIGDSDDLTGRAYNDPFENFCAAAAEAAGARMFRSLDPVFADYCLSSAAQDFQFALERMHLSHPKIARPLPVEVQLYGQGLVAAMELYKATSDARYLEDAVRMADVVLKCQQQEYPDWDVPIRGFFYETRKHERPLAYDHRAHEQAPVMGLALLCELASGHPKYPEWKKGLELYAEYIKSIAGYCAPYGLLPSAIYKLDAPKVPDTLEDYNEQVRNGIRLSDKFYLRRFPVAFLFRGFFGVLLTMAKATAVAARVLKDGELLRIVRRQLEWILGKNPFAQSFMYGEGYDFPPMYSEFANDMIGELPVGIQTFENHDIPFMPMMNSATYKEIWVHSSSRFLWTVADLYDSSNL